MPRPFDDLDAAGFDHTFEDVGDVLGRPTLSVSWACVDGNESRVGWDEGGGSSVPFELDGTQLSPADVVEFAESSKLYPGFSAHYTIIHRIGGFPVLRVQVDLDGNAAVEDAESVHTVYRKATGEIHDVEGHVSFVPVLSKVCGVVLAEVARHTIAHVLASHKGA